MRQEKIKIIICWSLVAVCMGIIFWLSGRTADESASQSSSVLQWLTNLFGDNIFTEFIVRKAAHCLEFTGLCVLVNLAFLQTYKKLMSLPSVLFTSLYAATDEIHQLFVEGRSCQLTDWMIDTLGAVIGAVSFILLYLFFKHIMTKKAKFIDRKNN